MRNHNKVTSWLLIISMALFFAACGAEEKKAVEAYKVPVSIAKVKKIKRSFPIYTTAKLAKSSEMKLSFKIGGIIDKIHVKAGDFVNKGKVLASLKQTEVKARVNQAQSGYEKAKRDLDRVNRLYKDSVATLEQLQNANTGLEMAGDNLKIARFNQLHSTIIAPVSGKVLLKFSEENELIGPGTPVLIMGAGRTNWILKAGIIDRDILKIATGDSAVVSFDAYPDTRFRGSITEISGAANPMTGLFEVEIALDQTTLPLFSGFIGRVTIFPHRLNSYAVISINSISEGNAHYAFVYIPDEKKERAKKIQVKVEKISETSVYISEGLENISEIIQEGTPYLTDNTEIEIKKL